MTREIAIGIIKELQNKPLENRELTALDLAISALKQITEVTGIIKAHMDGEDKNTKAVLSDVMESVNELETLEQEPCEDVVSRQAVINAIENDCMRGGLGSCFACYNDAQAFRGEIEKLPPVTQKSGKWIYDETIENWRCSKCNETPKTMGYVGTADFMTEHFKFCNHCGAKMVEPQESESDMQ